MFGLAGVLLSLGGLGTLLRFIFKADKSGIPTSKLKISLYLIIAGMLCLL